MTTDGRMGRMAWLGFAAACMALLAATLAPVAGASPGTSAARAGCGYAQLGSTYVTSISARHTSCRTGRAVAKKFTQCRKRHGGAKGHCRGKVKHYRCSENRFDKNRYQYSSKVSCKRGKRRVKLTYTQNT